MSYTYLLESGEESSAECYSDIPAFVPSKLSLSAEKFSCNGNATESSQNFQSGTTCELSTASRGEEKSTVSAEASPAKTFPQREKARVLTGREAGYGASSRVLLAKFDRDTRSWKTLQCSLFGDSDECLETFPRSGMTQNGLLWELTTLELRTGASASGFWRTPDTGAGGTVSEKALEEMANGNWKRPSGSQKQLRLQDQVRHPQLWPTPNCSGLDGGSNSHPTPLSSDFKKRGPTSKQQGLVDVVTKMYPTPKCQDARAALFDSKSNLGEVIHGRYLNGGNETPQTKTARLNPNWVEWLMGWPIGWTDSAPLATDKFRSWQQQLLTF